MRTQEVRQQRACCTIRRTALACLKEVESLLCGEGARLISARPRVHAHLLSDMRGAQGQAAPAQTPHLLRTPQTAGRPPPGQASNQAHADTNIGPWSMRSLRGLPGIAPGDLYTMAKDAGGQTVSTGCHTGSVTVIPIHCRYV